MLESIDNDKPLPVLDLVSISGKDFVVYGYSGNPLFLARDIAEVIDYAKNSNGAYNTAMMLKTVPENEKSLLTIVGPAPGGKTQRRKAWFVTENGFYTILMQSRRPIALRFQEDVKKILWSLRGMGTISNILSNLGYEERAPKQKTYLMKVSNTGYTKIGKALNLKFREKTLQSEKPCIILFAVCESLVEHELHVKFKDKRIRGEWFNLDMNDIEEIIDTYGFVKIISE